MVMAEARALLRAFAMGVSDVAKVLDLLNDFLAQDMTAGRFMSLFVASVDPAAGEVRWSSAGHNPVLQYRAAAKEVLRLESTGRVQLGTTGGPRQHPGDPAAQALVASLQRAATSRRPGR